VRGTYRIRRADLHNIVLERRRTSVGQGVYWEVQGYYGSVESAARAAVGLLGSQDLSDLQALVAKLDQVKREVIQIVREGAYDISGQREMNAERGRSARAARRSR
jgi:hypothetical protein